MDEQKTSSLYMDCKPLTELGLKSNVVDTTDFEEQIKKQDTTNQKIYNKINKTNASIIKTQKQLNDAIKLIESTTNIIHEQGESIGSLLSVVEKQQDNMTEIVNQLEYMKECDNTQLQAIHAIDVKTSKELVRLYGFSIFVVVLNLIEFFMLAFHTGLLKL